MEISVEEEKVEEEEKGDDKEEVDEEEEIANRKNGKSKQGPLRSTYNSLCQILNITQTGSGQEKTAVHDCRNSHPRYNVNIDSRVNILVNMSMNLARGVAMENRAVSITSLEDISELQHVT
ncbi:hypothetical protein M8J77_022550 [Diaphorina citri]|nr:hypothetical protein M8J77_019329 [Diaphorina citri]KAI5748166.1 hypothetical protein M8J77_022550 [Diaphorina citri]